MLIIVIVNLIHEMVMVAFVIDHILITFIIILGNWLSSTNLRY